MTFPEHVVDRVAAAMFEGSTVTDVRDRSAWPPAHEDDRTWWRERAVHALTALGFRVQRVPGVTRVHTRWVAMTDWEWE